MIYKYEGYCNCASKCELHIHDNVVIVTELEDNPGTSITNVAEVLATKVCKEFNIPLDKLIWIEHYKNNLKTYDVVKFTIMDGQLINPEWIPMK